jgi:nitrate reductase NapE component
VFGHDDCACELRAEIVVRAINAAAATKNFLFITLYPLLSVSWFFPQTTTVEMFWLVFGTLD